MPGIRAINAALGRVAKSDWTKQAPKPPRPVVKINSANLKPNKIIKKSSPAVSSNTDAIQKNSVKVKPAAKPKGNPPNKRKAEESRNSGASRLGSGSPTLGKSRDTRVARSKNPTGNRSK